MKVGWKVSESKLKSTAGVKGEVRKTDIYYTSLIRHYFVARVFGARQAQREVL
jgi:hypothetical protein